MRVVRSARLLSSTSYSLRPLYPLSQVKTSVLLSTTAFLRAKHHEPYNISNLVLELDALDSPYVRDFDKSRDGNTYKRSAAFSPWDLTAVIISSNKHGSTIAELKEAMNTLQLPTPIELDSISAFKAFARFRTAEEAQLTIDMINNRRAAHHTKLNAYRPRRTSREQSQIKKEMSNAHSLSLWLPLYESGNMSAAGLIARALIPQNPPTLHTRIDLASSYPQRPKEKVSLAQNPKIAEQKILACEDIHGLSRLTTEIGQSIDGCSYLSSNCPLLLGAIMRIYNRFRYQHGTRRVSVPRYVLAAEALNYINDTSALLNSRDFEIDSSLCNAGMYFASTVQSLAAVRHYVSMASQRQLTGDTPMGDKLRWKALKRVLSPLPGAARRPVPVSGRKTTPVIPHRAGRTSKDALAIVTGWQNDGVPVDQEQRQPCFATLGTPKLDLESYRLYIALLGEVGAQHALWYEWSHPNSAMYPMETADKRQMTFILAFLEAGNVRMALETFRKLDQSKLESHVPSTPDLRETLLAHYHGSGIENVSGRRFLRDLKELERVGSLDMVVELEKSLDIIEGSLVGIEDGIAREQI